MQKFNKEIMLPKLLKRKYLELIFDNLTKRSPNSTSILYIQIWSISYRSYPMYHRLWSIAYPQQPLKYPLKAMNSPVNQAYGKLYMEKSSFDIKPFIRLFAILNLLFTIGLFITSLMTTSYAGYYGFYLPASNANEIHLGNCLGFLRNIRSLSWNKPQKVPLGPKQTSGRLVPNAPPSYETIDESVAPSIVRPTWKTMILLPWKFLIRGLRK